jgi:hypothetical protein
MKSVEVSGVVAKVRVVGTFKRRFATPAVLPVAIRGMNPTATFGSSLSDDGMASVGFISVGPPKLFSLFLKDFGPPYESVSRE